MDNSDLCSLCGQHEFSGCEYITSKGALTIKFCFDGITYDATEDPDDGYRRYCGAISESGEKIRREFPPVPVVCHIDEYNSDMLIVRDMYNGKVIMKIGTDYHNDYYPVCVFDYTPENMSINQRKEALR